MNQLQLQNKNLEVCCTIMSEIEGLIELDDNNSKQIN